MPTIRKIPRTTKRYVEMYRASSDSDPTRSYVVAKDVRGQWACSCPAWTQHMPRHNCKHITRVLAMIANHGGEPVIPVMSEKELQADTKLSKTLSRFSLLEV
jgi:hypothetical protein